MTLVAAVACAGPPAELLTPVPLAGYGAAIDDALCAWAVRCRHVPDDATCRRLLDPKNSDVRYAIEAVAAGRLVYDPAQAARCLRDAGEAVCPAYPFGEACADVFTGQVPEGGACVTSAECRGGGACAEPVCDALCCVGTCGPPPPPAPALAAIGEACETHTDCVAIAYCELDHRCTALPDEPGEPCLYGCAWGDLYCDLDTLTCGRYAGPGEPCDEITSCDPAWAICDGVCRPRPGEGEACDDETRRCIAVTFCSGGVCVPRGGPGEPCEGDGQCVDRCDEEAGACAAWAPCL